MRIFCSCVKCSPDVDLGDPLTLEHRLDAKHGRPICGQTHAHEWTCTRSPGHDGPHEGAGAFGIYARWEDS